MKVLFLIAAVLVATASAHDFKQCGSVDHLHISSVNFTPDPIVAGKSVNIVVEGKTDESISGGTATLNVKIFGVVVYNLKFDVCTQLNVTCPINGPFQAILSDTIPSSVPAITAQGEVDFTDSTGAKVDCISMDLQIVKSSDDTPTVKPVQPKQSLSLTFRPELVQPEDDYLFRKEEIEQVFKNWMVKFEKEFETAHEYYSALDIFSRNHMMIVKHNAGNHSWTMAHNEFSHMSWEEFRSTRLGFNAPPPAKITSQSADFSWMNPADIPSSIDWTAKGAVTPVKNQGQCGSCWSFSATGGLEGAYAIKTGNLVSFSEQELVDCDSTDSGCNGGLMDNAFDWISKNGGLCSEADYPYHAADGTCEKSKCTNVPGSDIKSHTDVHQNEASLRAAVAQQPVSVAIEADQLGFQFYSGGVMTSSCGTQLDHGVLAVGYGSDNGTDYWKVKNSWGASWGESGYIRLERGKQQTGGQCGILLSASYPTL